MMNYEIKGSNTPLVSIVIINSRSKTNKDWVDRAIESALEQWFKSIEVVIIDNIERKFSIGKCFNYGVAKARSNWIMFLGDDDYLKKDYIYSLYNFAIEANEVVEDLVGVSSYTTVFYKDDTQIIWKKSPTGLWKKDYIMNNRFDESLQKYVDTEFLQRAIDNNKKYVIQYWNYGYYYRSHEGQVSGEKKVTCKT